MIRERMGINAEYSFRLQARSIDCVLRRPMVGGGLICNFGVDIGVSCYSFTDC